MNPAEPKVKRGTPSRLPELVETVNKVMRSKAPKGYGMGEAFPHLFSSENASNLYYIESDGKVVSHAGFVKYRCNINGSSISVASLGSVATLPEYRGRQYATKILRCIFSDLEKGDTSLLLISGTRGLYKRMECIETGRMLRARVSEGEIAQIRTHSASDVRHIPEKGRAGEGKRLLKIYRAEPYRYHRDSKFMRTVLNAFWFRRHDWNMQLFEVERGGSLMAYAVASTDSRNPEHVKIWEWAGSRQAFFESLADITSYYAGRSIEFSFLPDDFSMLSILASNNIAYSEENIQGTVRPMNVIRLIAELQPWFSEHLGAEVKVSTIAKGTWTFAGPFGTKKIVGAAKLTKWLFGTGRGSLGIQLMKTDDLNYI
ncbi:MAG: GNAT family N-acetyltransferase [Thermoplasmata archaeon]|uniref:GNAT family N-acetyltransferase n=1 Tax=Candidatus Sysuiplasma superficiale TaxID=2823368 RepID=A0A8J7YPQ1_9ARCH|nr:GNAT family N-acetyltransferase [Candidatus Sysuiplasma superficiale]MBX8643745.1 GNAT family N-acetyltransferase [Candidatus Sysuiplasma superficiale]